MTAPEAKRPAENPPPRTVGIREKFFAPIGNIVVAFQDADFCLTMLLALLLNEDTNVTLSFAVSLSFSKKLDVVKSIAPFKIKDQGLLAELDDIVKQLANAEQERNVIVHGHWITPVKDGPIGFYKPATRRDGLKNFLESKSMDDMQKVLAIIHKATERLFSFTGELHARGVIQQKVFPFTPKVENRSNG
jgi:hypothetical protein